jgi:hypothetical protein
MVEGKRHGKGIMKYLSGRIYEGMWGFDLREGHGYEVYSNGNVYHGDFVNGKLWFNIFYRKSMWKRCLYVGNRRNI